MHLIEVVALGILLSWWTFSISAHILRHKKSDKFFTLIKILIICFPFTRYSIPCIEFVKESKKYPKPITNFFLNIHKEYLMERGLFSINLCGIIINASLISIDFLLKILFGLQLSFMFLESITSIAVTFILTLIDYYYLTRRT
ncbi:MAG: hypothetical protein DRO65_00250 [Candidatus Altiarchaeales archaeon]|nr:MAG: hypothetical protein DRO65_00250 [Candidatus Altiarchaeales archaeon]